jgi:Dolichyl-phosphate-mannose-protein mannosyltransferase
MGISKKGKIVSFIVLIALVLHIYAGLSFIKTSAPTYDETVHLSSGYSHIAGGKYIMNIMDHPPFSEMLSAAPLFFYKLNSFMSHPYFSAKAPYHYGDLFVFNNTKSAKRIVNTARIFTFLIWTLLFSIFIFFFSKQLHSFESAAFALIIFASMPIFISNNALITTDSAAALFYFISFYFGAMASLTIGSEASRKKVLVYLCAAGFFTGLAMASKFSMVIIAPILVGIWGIDFFLIRKSDFKKFFIFLGIYILLAVFTLALVYKFNLFLYMEGLLSTLKRVNTGRPSFVWGHYSMNGVLWYFPFAFLIKTPIFVLLCSVFGFIAIALKPKKKYIWIIIPFIFYLFISITSRLQIGIRHILPLMPFICIIASIGMAEFYKNKKVALALVFSLILSSAFLFKTHPFYLSYFNSLIGGPDNGYKYLADSNVDWGQDIPELSKYLKENGNPPIIFAYFGVSRPEYYGIKHVPLGIISNIELKGTNEDLCKMDKVLFAISVTNLQSVYYRNKDTFNWLKDIKPVFRAGYSIFLYDLTKNKDGVSRLVEFFDNGKGENKAKCLLKRYNNSSKVK